jgi:hypothetical protein
MGGDASVLLAYHLKSLKLPVFLREYEKVGQQCAHECLASAHLAQKRKK